MAEYVMIIDGGLNCRTFHTQEASDAELSFLINNNGGDHPSSTCYTAVLVPADKLRDLLRAIENVQDTYCNEDADIEDTDCPAYAQALKDAVNELEIEPE